MAAPHPLRLLLAAPRGFCAGVDRAVQIVHETLKRYGAPVYVRHEIVHNRYVVESLEALGAVFVDSLEQCPTERPVIFSAHGVPKSTPQEATRRGMIWIDATCPLVSKVHREVSHHHREGRHVILVGHAGHPEVIGTMGQAPEGAISLVETLDDVARLTLPPGRPLAFSTQTTLAVDETAAIITALQTRFPGIHAPAKGDICYATTNRQRAVQAIAASAAAVLVIGAPNSSNSQRLADVAAAAGTGAVWLIQRAHDIPWSALDDVLSADPILGVTASASAPEELVTEVVATCRQRFAPVVVEEATTAIEDVVFPLPRQFRGADAEVR